MKSKNKKTKLISISLLALCFSMLAFGVYALKNATLTVGGTIGFKAHDCMVRVLTEIEGDGVVSVSETLTPNADGTPSAKRTFIDETPLGTTSQNQSVVKSEENHGIPKIYFTDLTEDGNAAVITFTFTVNNDSFYPITANIQTVVDETYVRSAIATESKEIAANGQDTLSVSYTLKKNANNDYDDLASLNYSIALEFGKASSGNNQQQVQDLDFNNLPQTHAELITALQNAGYTITVQQEDTHNNVYVVGASKNGLVYQFVVFDLDVEYENGAESAAKTMYSNMHSDMVSNGATDGVSGVVYYAYIADPNQGGQQDPQEPETPKEYAGEPVITYYEAPNDDKMHTRQITYYNDSKLTEVSYITLETFDTDGKTLLTTKTEYPNYDKVTGYMINNKVEIRNASNVIIEGGTFSYSDQILGYKSYNYYENKEQVACYSYSRVTGVSYYDEVNQQEVQNYVGYQVDARVKQNNGSWRITLYLTQDPTALVSDSAKIDYVRDEYFHTTTETYTDIEVDEKNSAHMISTSTSLETDIDGTFRYKASESYTYVVANNQAQRKTITSRTYNSNDEVESKKVRSYTTYESDESDRSYTVEDYIGESTLRCTQVWTTNGEADSETWYKNGVVSRTITRVKDEHNETTAYTERYYQNENLQYRLEVTYENKEEVKTWYNAQDEVIADPEINYENY